VEGSDGAGGIEGYRVAVDDYALPEVGFTADELAVLGLAGRVWEQASLGPAAQRAVRKLEALGDGTLVDGPVGIETRIATAEPSFPVLLDAVSSRRTVVFDYRKPGDEAPEAREVQPWGIASRRGHWYLVGHDARRGQARVFRLSRVVGTPKAVGAPGQYDVPEGVDVVGMIAASSPDPAEALARVRVSTGRAHGLRRRAAGDPTADVLEVPFSDGEALAVELVGLGPDAVALEPASLRAAVVRRLRAVAGEGAA
jgi:predicted DNA-binding transcriptional regulator YafY